MKLTRLGEFALIEKIRRRTPLGIGVRIGIGDDAAWLSHPGGTSLVTADLLIEGIHFNLDWTSADALGHKSLAVNLSDIAAMGGIPRYALVSLGIPSHFDSGKIEQYYRGFLALARESRVFLVGGDTNAAKSLIVSVCVLGHAPGAPIRRSGARAGDDIYITGTLGDSALGLHYLKGRRKLRTTKPRALAQLLARHHRPMPRLRIGALLGKNGMATAMIDVSDGLIQDLGHVCRDSGIGAVVWRDRLPLSEAYRALAGHDELSFALAGGEDYELLFCARPRARQQIARLARTARVPVNLIGRCVPARDGIHLLDSTGKAISVSFQGHDHFKRVGRPQLARRQGTLSASP